MKYEIGDRVWYMDGEEPTVGIVVQREQRMEPISSRVHQMYHADPGAALEPEYMVAWKLADEEGRYCLIPSDHDLLPERSVFGSAEELLADLKRQMIEAEGVP